MCAVLLLIFGAIFLESCTRSAAERLFTEQYPALYEAVYARDADSLLAFTEHESEFVQRQAWRALISTPVNNMDPFFEAVRNSPHRAAWVALSRKSLSESQLRQLHGIWEDAPSLRDDISLVLGQQGDEASLNFLIRNLDKIIDQGYEYESALAIGRMIGRLEISTVSERIIVQHAAIQNDPDIFRAYFYGYYRSGKKIEDERLQDIVWETYSHSDNPLIKQYVLRISFQNNAERFFEQIEISDVSKMNVQLAVEFAQQLNKLKWSEKLKEAFTQLLKHQNPVVNQVALQQIRNFPERPAPFDEIIIEEIIQAEGKESSVVLTAIEALEDRSQYLELMEDLSEGNDYLILKKLSIFKEELESSKFLELINRSSQSDNRMEVLFATQVLADWWTNLSQNEKTETVRREVVDILKSVLQRTDRSVTYIAQPLLMSDEIADEIEFSYYENLLQEFSLPEDVEVYQALSLVFKTHYESEAESLIDSLAGIGNTALNSTFNQHGWEVEEEEVTPVTFRRSNWERLVELGYYPVWVLETEKGSIQIKMDAIIAPVTILAMDSLIINGEYDDVAFHRVVPNFVVQGGDVETGDGFGGPDYVVPTESSEKEYERGVVGIASAGTDTEGSQYFIMHQWAPHLNSRYTVIGEVIEGMDVVDKIVVGDKVNRSYWRAAD